MGLRQSEGPDRLMCIPAVTFTVPDIGQPLSRFEAFAPLSHGNNDPLSRLGLNERLAQCLACGRRT